MIGINLKNFLSLSVERKMFSMEQTEKFYFENEYSIQNMEENYVKLICCYVNIICGDTQLCFQQRL